MTDPIPSPPTNVGASMALKIFAVVTVFLSMQEGTQAFSHTFDWTRFADINQLMVTAKAVGIGCLYGALQGALRAVQILLAVWSGPTLWTWLGPILAGAAAMVSNAAKGLVRIFRRTPASN